MNSVIATDCGSTTTKAIFIQKKGDVYRLVCRGEAPTTVEAPFEDVTLGVVNSISEIQEIIGRELLKEDKPLITKDGESGADIYISTSSAGGGLQMMVAGVIKSMTAESAQRAALGAGSIVMDVLSIDDGRMPYERINRIRQLRPDIVLLSGGTDGGTISHVVEMAEYISAAEPRPRFGSSFKLPVIYAGNASARDAVKNVFKEKVALSITDNIRPTLEVENLGPLRHKIHDIFLEHVMMQAPGYSKLMDWTNAPIMPTPMAVGLLMEMVAKRYSMNLIGVDIGGATTDTFSVFDGIFNRTVSANLGMSYSISNVLVEAGIENIMRWIPFKASAAEIRNAIKNKMIRPTTIPQNLESLILEQAIAREALRLAMEQHRLLATGLKGVHKERTVGDIVKVEEVESLVNLRKLNMLIGSGGVLSHAPRRNQSMLMMMDAYQPLGLTRLVVDSIFMMPHLGVLSTVNEKAALDVFWADCLVPLGDCISISGEGKQEEKAGTAEVLTDDGKIEKIELKFGNIYKVPMEAGKNWGVAVKPEKKFDAGGGKGREVTHKVQGGVVGLVIDCRGRPLAVSQQSMEKWFKQIGAF